MENEQQRTNVHFELKRIDYSLPYDQQPECKRHVLGAYANLARHNMTLAVNTIMLSVGMDTFNEDDIEDAFSKKHRKKIDLLDNTKKLALQTRLYRHFPFFKRLSLEDDEKKSVQLPKLLEIMSDFTGCMAMLRETYTHYMPYTSPDKMKIYQKLKERVGKNLDKLFENSSRVYKKGEKLSHEDNEVFETQRKLTPHEMTIMMNRDEEFATTLKKIQAEIEKRKKQYKENNKKQNEEIKRGIKPSKIIHPVSDTEVKIGNDLFIIGADGKSIRKKWNQYDRNPKYYARMNDPEKGISDAGIIYFICLFLDKQVAIDFMDEVGFTEQCNFSPSNIVYLKELMCMNRMRMVKMRLDSEMSDTALALDMMSELRKCPQPLYDVLDVDARDKFKDDNTVEWETEHQQEATIAESQQEDTEEHDAAPAKDTPRSTLVRWEDRFPELALQFIDRKCIFNDIRFQLRLGKYHFSFYDHTPQQSIDNSETLRILHKEMHGFGRIQEVEKIVKDKWKQFFDKKTVEDGLTRKTPDVSGQAPYITEQRPQYDIDEKSHSIGLRWDGWNNDGRKKKDKNGNDVKGPHYGDLNEKKVFVPYLPNLQSTSKDCNDKNMAESLLPPQCMLSLYELPAMVFHQYLLEKYGKDKSLTEQIIQKCCDNLRNFFSDIKNGTLKPLDTYHLKRSDIPKKIRKFMDGTIDDNFERLKKAANKRLEERLGKIELIQKKHLEKKERIGSKDNQFGKVRATIKTGQLGQWLMQDIMDWIPRSSIAHKKLNGQNYVLLQSSLALLGQTLDDEEGNEKVTLSNLKTMMQNAKIIAKDGEKHNAYKFHPFLYFIFQECYSESVIDFYETYLEQEIRWIKIMIEDINKTRTPDRTISRYQLIPFLHHDRTRWQKIDNNSVKSLASRYLEQPIQLPNGLFTEEIRKLLKEISQGNDFKELADELDKAENAAHLIRLYHTLAEKDDSQRFYHNEPQKNGSIKTPDEYGHLYRLFKKLYGDKNDTTNHHYKFGSKEINRMFTEKVEVLISNVKIVIKRIDYKIYEFIIRELNKTRSLTPVDVHLLVLHKKNDGIKDDERKAIERNLPGIRKKIGKDEDAIWGIYKKLKKMAAKVQNNERAIRRFKTQDVLLLYMARDILKAKSNNQNDFTADFLLKNICQGDQVLDKTIDFKWVVKINKKTKDDEEPTLIEKVIEQKKMKMKNYGQFYKFASDHQRLESLLSRLPQKIFQRGEIENELAYYDSDRSSIFRQVYVIESEALNAMPNLKEDVNAANDWFWYTDPKSGQRRARRNNFTNLLGILLSDNNAHDEVSKKILSSIRNAFGHNTYDVDMSIIFEGKENKRKIPEIANNIKYKMDEQTNELKEKLDK